MKKLLMTTPFKLKNMPQMDDFLSLLNSKGFEVEWLQAPLSEEQLVNKWPGVIAHIGCSDQMTTRALQAADRLKIISKIGVGYDTINIKTASEKGIVVTNTPGANADAVSEFTLALMLTMSRKVIEGDKLVRSGSYTRMQGYTLYNKTLGIIGLGNIGKAVAQLVAGFHMKIIAYGPFPDKDFALQHGIRLCSLDDILTKSDFITIHVPLTEVTRNLIGKRELHIMKPTAQIINTSRPGIINETALYYALKHGVILSAALDVLTGEPNISPDNPLLTLDNIVLTPHIAASSYEGLNKTIKAAVQNIIDFFEGRKPYGILNPKVLKF